MAPGDVTFRVRAASLLHPFTSSKSSDQDPEKHNFGQPALSEKLSVGEQTFADSNGHNTSGDDAAAHDRAAQRIVRSVPGQSMTFLPRFVRVIAGDVFLGTLLTAVLQRG